MNTVAKTVNGTPLDGPMLLHLADAYVGAINGGALPTISTAWQSVLVIANQQAAEAAFAHYQVGVRVRVRARIRVTNPNPNPYPEPNPNPNPNPNPTPTPSPSPTPNREAAIARPRAP